MVLDYTHLQSLYACGGSHVTILIARELREEGRAELGKEGEEEYLLNNTPINYLHKNFKNYVADFFNTPRHELHAEH